MFTRQKSFFEQDHRPKPSSKPYFPTSRKTNEAATSRLVAKAPIMPGTLTRKKLKAFQFIEGAPTTFSGPVQNDENKENHPSEELLAEAKTKTKPQQTPVKTSKNRGVTSTVSKELLPSTPATRLPLADLLGNADETGKQEPSSTVSPEERILWLPAPSPNASRPRATPTVSRKRARSSSPASSQVDATTTLPGNIGDQDAINSAQALHTPQTDPAADLWNRYATGAATKEGVGIKTPVLANLIRGSSPKSSATAGSVGGLRRWASCGVEWPASRSKRRKIAHAMARRPTDDEAYDVEGAKASKVAELLERMKETLLSRPDPELAKCPSSSSPLPAAGSTTDATSPLQRLAPISDNSRRLQTELQAKEGVEEEAALRSTKTSSDYGDLDMEEFDDADLNRRYSPLHRQPPFEKAHVQPPVVVVQTFYQPEDPSQAAQVGASDHFGSDDELFVADLEVFASNYDTQHSASESKSCAPFESIPSSHQHQSLCGQAPDPYQGIEDEFEDDIDLDQLAAVEAMVSQQNQNKAPEYKPSEPSKKAIQRYLIKAIYDDIYIDRHERKQNQKVLAVDEERSNAPKCILLRQSWYATPATTGCYVHIIGEFSVSGQCIIDNCSNMIILHPDHLISTTTVADAFGCMRRAVLQDRVKATSDANPALLYGSVLHELFQEALKANRWDIPSLKEALQRILPRHYETMVTIGLNLAQVDEHLMSKIPEMQSWARTFVQPTPQATAIVKARGGKTVLAAVDKLLDVEEHVWSPMYGLKGNIDATVQVIMQEDGNERVLTVPLEVKTGKRGNECHVAQTALYTLLLSDRYDVEIFYGLLYYLETSETSRIEAVRHELIHMVMKRNELACYVKERLSLPPVLRNSHLCGRCYAQTTCQLYHKLTEDGDAETAPAKDQFTQLVKHLKATDQIFFQKWDSLLTKEEKEMMRFRRELWTMVSQEREKLGRCFSNLVLEPDTAIANEEASKINRYQYTFVKRSASGSFSFAESKISVGEPIVISDEDGHFALANGYVTTVSKRKIRVAVDRRLHNARIRQPGFDGQNNQSFAGIMQVGKTGMTSPGAEDFNDSTQQEPILYRLDKDEFSNGMATVRNNLLQIMDSSVFKSMDLRSLIIDGRAPRFSHNSSISATQSQVWHNQMNADQRAAVEKVMKAEDYALVLGMPGTGKTTTIAHIIRALVMKGKSVLLTSYTHTAVDNILLKIKGAGFDILRLGATAKVHVEVQSFAILAAEPKSSLEELRASWHQPPVVATTCLGLNHPIFTQRTFDVCIVDEASQVTLPVCIGPIRMAKSFILVGDHFQLPPLVQSREALEGGLDMSLFRLLCEQHPEAVVSLEHQYRMCEDIMLLANELIYNGRLKCGNDAVAKRTLELPQRDQALINHHYPPTESQMSPRLVAVHPVACKLQPQECFLGSVLDPQNKVFFINTDGLNTTSREILQGHRITNALEVAIVAQLTCLFTSAGLAPVDLGIITFYRSQLALLRQALRSHPSVELHTADKFQGRDKEAAIVSFVRNNESGEVGELLKDWRRVNVAITRARSKLILIGSKKTLLQGGDVLKGLVKICEQRGWIIDLHPGAIDAHYFPEIVGSSLEITQPSPVAAASSKKSLGSPAKRARKDGSRSSPMRPSATEPKVGQAGPALKAIGAIEDRNRGVNSAKRALHKPFKVPEKVARISGEKVLKRRPILNDILNDLM